MNLTRRQFLAAAGAAAGAALAGGDAADAAAPPAMPLYPDDAFSRPPLDRLSVFRHGSGCAPAADPISRERLFVSNSLSFEGSGSSRVMLWSVQPREAAERALTVETRIRRMPRAIYLQMQNRTDLPLTVTLQANEMSWLPTPENTAVSWMFGKGCGLAAGARSRMRFDFSDASPLGADPGRPIRFPLTSLILRLTVEEPLAGTAVALEALDVEYGTAPSLSVTVLDAPAMLTPGGAVPVEIECNGTAGGRTIDLELFNGNRTYWRWGLTREQAELLGRERLRLAPKLPWFIPGASYDLRLVAGGYWADGASAAVRVSEGQKPELARCQRKISRGRPALFVNGRQRIWNGYASYDYQPGSVRQFALSGATAFCVPTSAGAHIHNVSEPTLPEPGRFDFSELDERVCFSLQHAPDALIIPRVSLAMPLWWVLENERQRALVSTPEGLRKWEETMTPAVSIASRRWMAAQKEALGELIRYCRRRPWASQVAGFLLTGEVTEEWFAWGCNNGLLADYSEPGRQAFRRWLLEAGLQEQDVPAAPSREVGAADLYRDDEAGAAAARYSRFYSELTSDVICELAAEVKKQTGGRSLVGCFNGYVIQLAGEPRQATSGHFAVRRLLEDGNIDFLCGIPLLDYRRLLDGYNPFAAAAESAMSAGKLYLNENDLFSWLHPIIWHTPYDPADPRGGAISMHRRECAHDAVTGAISQKFSLMCSWHADRALQADFKMQARALARAAAFDKTPAHEIALLVDETSFAWTPPGSTLKQWTHKALLHKLGRMGTSVGVWLLDDLDQLPDSVRLVVVADAAAAPARVLAKLRAEIEGSGRSFIVIGPAGLVDPGNGRWNRDATAILLGLPVQVSDKPGPDTMLSAAGDLVTKLSQPPCPHAYSQSAGLLLFADGRGASAERTTAGGGRLLWTSLPPIEGPLLRQQAADAGVHFYAQEGSIVHASRGLLAVTCQSAQAGQMKVNLKREKVVEDLFDGWSGEGKELLTPFAPGQTRLFAFLNPENEGGPSNRG